jgi:Icc-related predicted phosphoesterase
MGLLRRSNGNLSRLRLFFATDVHGSERCFRKFLNAASVYKVDHLILGGDITGKSLVPIERTSQGFRANYNDHAYAGLGEVELEELKQRIRNSGQYPIVGERDELLSLTNEAHREEVFKEVAVAEMRRWAELAEERLAGTPTRLYVAPGNDDFWEVDEALRGGEAVQFAEGQRLRIDEKHEIIVTGYSNPTPWETFRELDEPALRSKLEQMMDGVEDPANLIAVLHPPPADTALDQAPAIDEDFQVQMQTGAVRFASVGSIAVREFIEEHQPLLGLHGHVHESRGEERIGRTLVLNPGSEYTIGTLAGVIVTVGDGRVISHQFITG